MSTYWDEFLEVNRELTAGWTRARLLKEFYLWLVKEGVIHD